jgi:hypothetical protein
LSSTNQQVSPNDISANFFNSSVGYANTFQMMRTILLQTIEVNKQLKQEITNLDKTIQSQYEELLKLKKIGTGKAD